jgi:hypothetical protein
MNKEKKLRNNERMRETLNKHTRMSNEQYMRKKRWRLSNDNGTGRIIYVLYVYVGK